MASADDASVGDGPFIVLPPIPSSCFSPVATITGIGSLTSAVLPDNTECAPWAVGTGYSLSSAYSTRGVCPSGWIYDDAWNTERDALARTRVCCPSGFTAAREDITTTFTSSGTSTLDVGSSVFSTEFTAVLRTSWPSGTCYSTLSAPTVLKVAVSTGQPSESLTITNDMLVSASYVRIKSLVGGPSVTPSSGGSASSSSRGSTSPTSRGPTSPTSRGSNSPTSRGSTSPSLPGSTSPGPNDPAVSSSDASSDTSTKATVFRPQSSGLSQGATIGLAVGITAVVMALLFGLYIIFSRRRRRRRRRQTQFQQSAYQVASAPYPELETRPAQNESYVMLDSGSKFELAADHSWRTVEAPPGQAVAG